MAPAIRIMRDSTVAADIPLDTPIVAGYVDMWSAADWARFPNNIHVKIARFANEDGDVLDVENTLATPNQAPAWVVRQRKRGVEPAVYVNRANWTACQNAFLAAHVAAPFWWVSTLDGTILPLGGNLIAVQYAGQNRTGHHYDESVVSDDFIKGIEMGLTQQEHDWMALLVTALCPGVNINDRSTWPNYPKLLADLKADVDSIKAGSGVVELSTLTGTFTGKLTP